MSDFFEFFTAVHDPVHDLRMKPNFSEPKIYTGGVDVSQWSKLSKEERQDALAKDWYVYYSFRHPETGKLKRQPNIKAGANHHKTKRARLAHLKSIQRNLLFLLEYGFSPFENNADRKARFAKDYPEVLGDKDFKSASGQGVAISKRHTPLLLQPEQQILQQQQQQNGQQVQQQTLREQQNAHLNQQNATLAQQKAVRANTSNGEKHNVACNKTEEQQHQGQTSKVISGHSIEDCIALVLNIKKKVLSENSYNNYSGRIRRFKKWLDQEFPEIEMISQLTKSVVNKYLNGVLMATSARNRNNTRTDLSSFFQTLVDNERVPQNFVKSISQLKTQPSRNKSYTPVQLAEIETYLEKEDPLLLLFIRFVSYPFLRPVEICRLKVRDLDLADKKLYVRSKTKKLKVKIIPEILAQDLPDLSNYSPDHFLFTPEGLGRPWEVKETLRRDYFSKRFKKVKETLGLGKDYGLYSFRHTYITRLYQNLRKDCSAFEAKSRLLPITGHQTMTALEKYLRDIDAELPEDYSHLY